VSWISLCTIGCLIGPYFNKVRVWVGWVKKCFISLRRTASLLAEGKKKKTNKCVTFVCALNGKAKVKFKLQAVHKVWQITWYLYVKFADKTLASVAKKCKKRP
jgi:hypothetical protein